MQVKNVDDEGVVRCVVLHFKPGALVWRSAENSQVSLTQFQKREGTGIHQSQGLIILANVGEPKLTVDAIVVFEVFDRRMCRVQVNILGGIVYSLTRIFNIHAKVRDVVI